jgi:predicted kinase
MKTAMQELIDDFKNRANFSSNMIASTVWDKAVSLLEQKLPQDRKQIEDAYNDAKSHAESGTLIEMSMEGDDYFTQNYEQ